MLSSIGSGRASSQIGNETVRRRKLVLLFVVMILLAAGAASTIKALGHNRPTVTGNHNPINAGESP